MTDGGREIRLGIHQPTQAEMEEEFEIDGTLDQIAAAVLAGGVAMREPVHQPLLLTGFSRSRPVAPNFALSLPRDGAAGHPSRRIT